MLTYFPNINCRIITSSIFASITSGEFKSEEFNEKVSWEYNEFVFRISIYDGSTFPYLLEAASVPRRSVFKSTYVIV